MNKVIIIFFNKDILLPHVLLNFMLWLFRFPVLKLLPDHYWEFFNFPDRVYKGFEQVIHWQPFPVLSSRDDQGQALGIVRGQACFSKQAQPTTMRRFQPHGCSQR
ncbi:MAG: hypothetical protein JXR70_11810 [Spirochaetales bacterium]|nr:hypothetical protein [Spirochaetales bacterium]